MILETVLIIFLLYVLYTQHRMQQIVVESETTLLDDPLSSEETVFYQECKQYYDITGTPLISISEEISSDHVGLTSVSLKFGIDEEYEIFNVEEFLNKICNVLNLNTNEARVTKLQRGSVILEISIDRKKVNIELVIHKMQGPLTEKEQEELSKLKVFFMFMGDIKSLNSQQKFRNEVRLYPQWNCVYGLGHTYWTGALQDEKDRGKYAYFCPVGWKRYALHVSDNFDEKFKGWSICYHGTKFAYGLSIFLSGLAPARCAQLGKGIYASQSITYTSHPRYAEIKRIKSSDKKNFFKSGQYVQFVLQCRVRPTSIKVVGPETLRVGKKVTIDPDVSNDVIEWVIDAKNKDLMDFSDPNTTIICTGVMIRIIDHHPGLLPESQWWYPPAHLCNSRHCCALGIDLTELIKQNKNAPLRSAQTDFNVIWKKNGVTVAGRNGQGNGVNQISLPLGLYVDRQGTVYIADWCNHRVVQYIPGETKDRLMAGGNGKGNKNDQLHYVTDMIVDIKRDCLFICDMGNKRIVQWPLRGAKYGNPIITGVSSFGLTMDEEGFLYICDFEKHEVRRWQVGASQGHVVAGGNGQGDRCDQLNGPASIFVDRNHSVYVSEYENHRVVKWVKNAETGILVAGGNGSGTSLSQLSYPRGIVVDQLGTVIVADTGNHRIVRWQEGKEEGTIVVGGNGKGLQPNQVNCPIGLSLDLDGNLYVVEHQNHRVQKFEIDRS